MTNQYKNICDKLDEANDRIRELEEKLNELN